jgi:LuxR family quorum-sensing transcriptional regulator LasR
MVSEAGPLSTKTYTFFGQDYRLQFLDLNTAPPLHGPFDLDATVRKLGSLASPEDVFSCAIHAAHSMGFDSVSYGAMFKAAELAPLLVVSTPLSLTTWEACHAAGLLELDETIVHVATRRTPGVWHLHDSQLSRMQPLLVRQWATFCQSRIFVPLHGPLEEVGILAFNSTQPSIADVVGSRLTEVMMQIQFLATHVHERLCQIGLWNKTFENEVGASTVFTSKEKDVLLFLSKGNTTQQVSELMGLAEATVNYYIRKLKGKLRAETIGEALAKAVDLGIIKPRALLASHLHIDLSPYANSMNAGES